MKIALYELGIVTVLWAGFEIFADHELEKPDIVV
jgi:hypothetical protein